MRLFKLFLAAVLLSGPALAGGSSVSYEIDGREYEGYYVSPAPDAPLVVMVHDWDGLTDYELKRAAMLAKEGYAVFAVDMFGKGVRPTEMAEKRKLTGELYADRAKMMKVFNAGLEAAGKQGAMLDNAVAMGYCFGGTVVLEAARSGLDLKAFAGFHAGLSTPEGQGFAAVKGKVILFHGTADKVVSMDDFAKVAAALESSGVDHEMITYGGAPHAFSVFGSDRYREEADKQSWARFLKFLSESLRSK